MYCVIRMKCFPSRKRNYQEIHRTVLYIKWAAETAIVYVCDENDGTSLQMKLIVDPYLYLYLKLKFKMHLEWRPYTLIIVMDLACRRGKLLMTMTTMLNKLVGI